jgi:hypothetical protein
VNLYDGMNVIEGLGKSGNILARYMHGAVIDEDLSVLSNDTTSYYHCSNYPVALASASKRPAARVSI